MRFRIIAALSPFAALAACASVAPAELSEKAAAKLADYEKTGESESCISLSRIDQIDPLSDSLFLVRAKGNDYYLNEVSGRCTNAGRSFTRLQYTTSLSQLCRNEIITVVDNQNGFTVGSCSLGAFERAEKKPKEKPAESGR